VKHPVYVEYAISVVLDSQVIYIL